MSDAIVWEAPPEVALRRLVRSRYNEFAEALRENPRSWAVLPGARTPDSAKGAALNLRMGKMKAFRPQKEWEAVAHEGKVYVRYVGPPGDTEDLSVTADSDTEMDVPPVPQSWESHRVRLWARQNGWPELADRGRLPEAVLQAYSRAHSSEVGEVDEVDEG